MEAFSTDMESSIRENWAKTEREREKEKIASLGQLRKRIYDSLCVKADAHKGIPFEFDDIIHTADIIIFIKKLNILLPNATICWEHVKHDDNPGYPNILTWTNLVEDEPTEDHEWKAKWKIHLY